MAVQLALFDYQQLAPEARAVAIEAAAKIKLHGRRAAESIVAIGEELARVKAALPHGAWLPWLEAEFGWSDQQARNFLHVFEAFKSKKFLNLEIDASALYLLARPSTPEPARDAALKRAESGERISHGFVKDLIQETREKVRDAFPEALSEPDVEPAPPRPSDEAKRKAFVLDAAFQGRIYDFDSLLDEAPAAVAATVDPLAKARVTGKVTKLIGWLEAVLTEMEKRHAA